MKGKVDFMSGNDACAYGAIYAGLKFFAGYPITPSSEIAELLSRELPKRKGIFIQMEDEIASMGAIIGASLSGAKSMTATSGPGFSLKQEHIGFAVIAEVPCVIVDVQRGGPSTGFPTGPSQSDVMQARWGTHGDHPIIVVSPTSVQECFTETVRAFNLAEKYRTPVIILMDEVVGHMREKIIVPEEGEIPIINRTKPSVPPEKYKPYDESFGDVPPLAEYGTGYRFHVTGLNHDETGFPTNNGEIIQRTEMRLMRKIYGNLDDIVKVGDLYLDDAPEVVIITFGCTVRSAKSAVRILREKKIKAGLLSVYTVWPSPEKEIGEATRNARLVVVPEMNLGQYIFEVERCVKSGAKVVGVNKINTEPITPLEIIECVEKHINLK